MRKDELLYLHHLLALVREEFVRRGVAEPEAFERYDELGVSPIAVYASKREHARAVRTLSAALAAAVEESGDRGQAIASA